MGCQGEAWPDEVDAVVDVRVTVVLLVVEEMLVGEVVVVAVVVSVPHRSDTRLWHTSFGRRAPTEGIARSVEPCKCALHFWGLCFGKSEFSRECAIKQSMNSVQPFVSGRAHQA